MKKTATIQRRRNKFIERRIINENIEILYFDGNDDQAIHIFLLVLKCNYANKLIAKIT
jgi:hypothetical protein